MKERWGCYYLILGRGNYLFFMITKDLFKTHAYNIAKIIILKDIIFNINDLYLFISI